MDISTLTEEDSQKLSISICSNDINTKKNSNKLNNNNCNTNNSNKLTMKLKENKKYLLGNLNNKINESLNINLNNKSFNNIYIKKKNLKNNNNKINIKLKGKFSQEKLKKKKFINKINNSQKNNLFIKENIISSKIIHITKDNKLNISMSSIKLDNHKSNNHKYNNLYLKYDNFYLKIINNNFIFENKNRSQKKVYNHIKNNNSFMIKSSKEKLKELFNNRSPIKNKNKVDHNQNNLIEYKNIIMNCQNNKYLKGCINFLIKAIKKLLLNIFINLKYYSKYYQLRNTINKINIKKIKNYYFTLFKKKIKNKNSEKSKNTKGKKIIFNEITKRYELVNNS